MLALTELSELSMLDDELDKLFELVSRTARAVSMLDEELERLRLDV
jgi:predicted house-cleaning noncanonical NTP pyrophosphatase (MazG superfamily)